MSLGCPWVYEEKRGRKSASPQSHDQRIQICNKSPGHGEIVTSITPLFRPQGVILTKYLIYYVKLLFATLVTAAATNPHSCPFELLHFVNGERLSDDSPGQALSQC